MHGNKREWPNPVVANSSCMVINMINIVFSLVVFDYPLSLFPVALAVISNVFLSSSTKMLLDEGDEDGSE